jgi:hypothetical protein
MNLSRVDPAGNLDRPPGRTADVALLYCGGLGQGLRAEPWVSDSALDRAKVPFTHPTPLRQISCRLGPIQPCHATRWPCARHVVKQRDGEKALRRTVGSDLSSREARSRSPDMKCTARVSIRPRRAPWRC